MLNGLFIASLVGNCVELLNEKFEKPVPAEYWKNKELYHQDMMKGVPVEQRIKNLKNGKYRLVRAEEQQHPEPHRATDGRIVIENCALYDEDVRQYGAYQAHQWVKQGRYNLKPEELEKERQKHREHFKKLYNLP